MGGVVAGAGILEQRDAVIVAADHPASERGLVDGVLRAQARVEGVGVGAKRGFERVEHDGRCLRHASFPSTSLVCDSGAMIAEGVGRLLARWAGQAGRQLGVGPSRNKTPGR